MPFESLLERTFLDICRLDRGVASVQSQPFTLAYRDRVGRRRTYTPDFLVSLTGAQGLSISVPATTLELIVEVKPRRILKRDYSLLRGCFAAARIWCEQATNRRFLIVTDEAMAGGLRDNALLLGPYLFAQASLEHNATVKAALSRERSCEIGALIARAGGEDSERWALQREVFRMILYGELVVSLSKPITKRTVVSLVRPSGL